MFIVLPKRILKLIGGSVYLLSPRGLLSISKNPSAIILRLDHEDSKRRADDMVDLGRVFAIGTGKDEVLRTQLDMDSHGSLVRNPTLWFFVPGLGHSCDPGFDST